MYPLSLVHVVLTLVGLLFNITLEEVIKSVRDALQPVFSFETS